MNRTRELLEGDGWAAEDVHATRSYDFHCHKTGEELRVEVKGTDHVRERCPSDSERGRARASQ